MTIIVGTDFSRDAIRATDAAGSIARQMGVPVALVHAVPLEAGEAGPSPVREQLADAATRLSGRYGVQVQPILASGAAESLLVQVARDLRARFIIVAALGHGGALQRLVGSTAERLARESPIPTFVLRDPERVEAWANGERSLEAVVGVELNAASKAALRWARDLREIGRCNLQVVKVAWPPGEYDRLGLKGEMPLDELRPDLAELLTRDLREWAGGELEGAGETRFVVQHGFGRTDAHLALLAARSHADLVVVGTHRRALVDRLWTGSVSRGVLHGAATNVACVPCPLAAESEPAVLRRILAPTDFSPLSVRAIRTACALVPPGGSVHLVHVVTSEPSEAEHATISTALRDVLAVVGAPHSIFVDFELVRDDDVARGILRAGERAGVDAICMGIHGRGGVLETLSGSKARRVVNCARDPVILVPDERD